MMKNRTIAKAGRILKSDQEQAMASWINYLNKTRIDKMVQEMNIQDMHHSEAIATINNTLNKIKANIIQNNRGGTNGSHGFIAEVAECGIGNAREHLLGRNSIYKYLDNNGPIDLNRNGTGIQMKFSAAGNHLSLYAVREHLSKYPWFLESGYKYMIPEDHYWKIKYLLELPPEKANKIPTSEDFSLKQWKEVNKFFRDGEIRFEDLEPSILKYGEVQRGTYEQTLDAEKKSLAAKNRNIKEGIQYDHRPTIEEGLKAAGWSALVEGAFGLAGSVIHKRSSGKRIQDFDEQDWMVVLKQAGLGTLKGGVRGAVIYSLSNAVKAPAAAASSVCTVSFGVAELAYQLRNKKISEAEFLQNSQILSLNCSVSTVSSLLGQMIIPVPVLGAVIGNSAGMLLLQISKDHLSKIEI